MRACCAPAPAPRSETGTKRLAPLGLGAVDEDPLLTDKIDVEHFLASPSVHHGNAFARASEMPLSSTQAHDPLLVDPALMAVGPTPTVGQEQLIESSPDELATGATILAPASAPSVRFGGDADMDDAPAGGAGLRTHALLTHSLDAGAAPSAGKLRDDLASAAAEGDRPPGQLIQSRGGSQMAPKQPLTVTFRAADLLAVAHPDPDDARRSSSNGGAASPGTPGSARQRHMDSARLNAALKASTSSFASGSGALRLTGGLGVHSSPAVRAAMPCSVDTAVGATVAPGSAMTDGGALAPGSGRQGGGSANMLHKLIEGGPSRSHSHVAGSAKPQSTPSFSAGSAALARLLSLRTGSRPSPGGAQQRAAAQPATADTAADAARSPLPKAAPPLSSSSSSGAPGPQGSRHGLKPLLFRLSLFGTTAGGAGVQEDRGGAGAGAAADAAALHVSTPMTPLVHDVGGGVGTAMHADGPEPSGKLAQVRGAARSCGRGERPAGQCSAERAATPSSDHQLPSLPRLRPRR